MTLAILTCGIILNSLPAPGSKGVTPVRLGIVLDYKPILVTPALFINRKENFMSENIHTAILKVMSEVGYVQKKRTQGLNYSYAGEAALIEAIRPAMIEAGITMHVSDVQHVASNDYTTKNGAVMHSLSIISQITFSHAASGTSITSQAFGEGADSGDKAAYKAQTGAYKYALRQTFCIETGDDPDKYDSKEQERKPEPNGKPAPKSGKAKVWDGAVIHAVMQSDERITAPQHATAMLNLSKVLNPETTTPEQALSWAQHYSVQRELSDDRDHCVAEADKMIKE